MQPMNDMKDEMAKHVKTGKEEVTKSAKDWFCYIQKHPLQTMLFGIVLFFAAKGMASD